MKINLMPPDPPVVRVRVIVFTVIVGVLSAWCVYLGVTYYSDIISLKSVQMAQSEAQLTLQSLLAKSQQTQQTTGLQQLLREARAIAASAPTPEEDIGSLLATVPVGGQLTTVSFANGQMTGTVAVPNYDVAAQFVSRLQSDKTFTNVVVSSVTEGGGGQIAQAQSTQAQALAQAQILGLLTKAPQLASQSGVVVTFTMSASASVNGTASQGGNP